MNSKLKFLAILVLCLPVSAHDNYVPAKASTSVSVNLINNSENDDSISMSESDDEDFRRLREKQYGTNQKQFYYFSRWHKYLEDVEAEKKRKEEYDREMREYNKEVERINKENEKIKEYNENLESYNSNIGSRTQNNSQRQQKYYAYESSGDSKKG